MKKEKFKKELKYTTEKFSKLKLYEKNIEPNHWLYIELTLIQLFCKASNRTKVKTKKEIDLLIKFIEKEILKTNSTNLIELKSNLKYLMENL